MRGNGRFGKEREASGRKGRRREGGMGVVIGRSEIRNRTGSEGKWEW